jgi:hypothetical protein
MDGPLGGFALAGVLEGARRGGAVVSTARAAPRQPAPAARARRTELRNTRAGKRSRADSRSARSTGRAAPLPRPIPARVAIAHARRRRPQRVRASRRTAEREPKDLQGYWAGRFKELKWLYSHGCTIAEHFGDALHYLRGIIAHADDGVGAHPCSVVNHAIERATAAKLIKCTVCYKYGRPDTARCNVFPSRRTIQHNAYHHRYSQRASRRGRM